MNITVSTQRRFYSKSYVLYHRLLSETTEAAWPGLDFRYRNSFLNTRAAGRPASAWHRGLELLHCSIPRGTAVTFHGLYSVISWKRLGGRQSLAFVLPEVLTTDLSLGWVIYIIVKSIKYVLGNCLFPLLVFLMCFSSQDSQCPDLPQFLYSYLVSFHLVGAWGLYFTFLYINLMDLCSCGNI